MNAALAKSVLLYWQEQTHTNPRSEKLIAAYLKRICQRLQEGFSASNLCGCVDAALRDEFYRQQGYCKRPEVLWRNAERVASLLGRGRAPLKRDVVEVLSEDELAVARRQRDEWLAEFRARGAK